MTIDTTDEAIVHAIGRLESMVDDRLHNFDDIRTAIDLLRAIGPERAAHNSRVNALLTANNDLVEQVRKARHRARVSDEIAGAVGDRCTVLQDRYDALREDVARARGEAAAVKREQARGSIPLRAAQDAAAEWKHRAEAAEARIAELERELSDARTLAGRVQGIKDALTVINRHLDTLRTNRDGKVGVMREVTNSIIEWMQNVRNNVAALMPTDDPDGGDENEDAT
ncbi:MAG: hypothetical protein ACK53W_12450 [Gemmatimonadota bacterium]